MNLWILLLIGLNLFVLGSLVVVWKKFSQPMRDDPRLSKGLQLLQSKIAILEDLSERTDNQVNQMIKILDNKVKDVQLAAQKADKKIIQIERSIKKSLEVAEIFEDKIPHEEIIERQNSKKYMKAAKLAFQGKSREEIAQVVELTDAELDFIVKLNRDQMLVDDQTLPGWVASEGDDDEGYSNIDTSEAFDRIENPLQKIEKIRGDFQQAVAKAEKGDSKASTRSGFQPLAKDRIQNFVDSILNGNESAPVSQTANDSLDWIEPEEETFADDSRPTDNTQAHHKVASFEVASGDGRTQNSSQNSSTVSPALRRFQKQQAEAAQTAPNFALSAIEDEKATTTQFATHQDSSGKTQSRRHPAQKVSAFQAELNGRVESKQPKNKEVRFNFSAEALQKAASEPSGRSPIISGSGNSGEIQKVEFPKLDLTKNLS